MAHCGCEVACIPSEQLGTTEQHQQKARGQTKKAQHQFLESRIGLQGLSLEQIGQVALVSDPQAIKFKCLFHLHRLCTSQMKVREQGLHESLEVLTDARPGVAPPTESMARPPKEM